MIISFSFLPYSIFIFVYFIYSKLTSGGYDFKKKSKLYLILTIYSVLLFFDCWFTLYKNEKAMFIYLVLMGIATCASCFIKIKVDDAKAFEEALKEDSFKKVFFKYEMLLIVFTFLPSLIEIINNILIKGLKYNFFKTKLIFNIVFILYGIFYFLFILKIVQFLKVQINNKKSQLDNQNDNNSVI